MNGVRVELFRMSAAIEEAAAWALGAGTVCTHIMRSITFLKVLAIIFL